MSVPAPEMWGKPGESRGLRWRKWEGVVGVKLVWWCNTPLVFPKRTGQMWPSYLADEMEGLLHYKDSLPVMRQIRIKPSGPVQILQASGQGKVSLATDFPPKLKLPKDNRTVICRGWWRVGGIPWARNSQMLLKLHAWVDGIHIRRRIKMKELWRWGMKVVVSLK